MGDVICNICGEPWDFWGMMHGDMTKTEARTMLSGEGCPCCKGKRPDDADRTLEWMKSLDEGTDLDPFEFI